MEYLICTKVEEQRIRFFWRARCSAPVIFVETELQIIQKVQRTGILKADADCGALHLENHPSMQNLQTFRGSAAFLISKIMFTATSDNSLLCF